VPAPSFSLPDLRDKTVRLADFAGKPLIVNFFTAETCDWAGAVLAKLHGEYSGRGVQFVGIDLYDDNAAIRRCMTKHGVKYPVLRGDEATQKAWIGSSSGWATFFVTADGKIAKKIADSIENGLEGPVFAKYAESLLGKKP
jgi:peroxiredoxin